MLPVEYDSFVTVVDVDERIAETLTVVGDLGKQIEELAEAMMLLMGHAGKTMRSSIHPPVNVMLYGRVSHFTRRPDGRSLLQSCRPVTSPDDYR